jgi:hypothetical protein
MTINSLPDFIEVFENQLNEAKKICFFVRGDEIQNQTISNLERLKMECLSLQRHYIEKEDEESANKLLSCKAFINAVQYELRMYICLKQNDLNEAWNRLIDAQQSVTVAIKAHEIFAHYSELYLEYLENLENILFPPQIFLSSGTIVKSKKCSICEMEFDDCEHIMGKAYMGKMCGARIDKCDLQELSIVKIPADKHCRAYIFQGIDTMTGRINKNSFENEKLKADFEGVAIYTGGNG